MWTPPKTNWQVNEIVTADDMNTIGENLATLKAPVTAQYLQSATDYTTTSTSFVDVDATNFSHTITTTGGDVLIIFFATITNNLNNANMMFDVTVDGVRQGGVEGLILETVSAATHGAVVSFALLKTGLSAGSHTIKLQWSVGGGTGRIYAGSTAGGREVAGFTVREVS